MIGCWAQRLMDYVRCALDLTLSRSVSDPEPTAPASGYGPRYVELLDAAAARLLSPQDPARLVQDLFELIAGELRLDVFFNYRLGEDGALHLLASGGISGEAAEAGARLELGVAVCGCVARDRTPAHVTAVHQSDDPLHAFIKGVGLQVYACTPMVAGERLLGTLGFGRRWTSRFEPDELQFLRAITHHLAVAHEHLRHVAAMRRGEQRLSAVLDNASVAILSVDEAGRCDYLNPAAERLLRLTPAQAGDRVLVDLLGADDRLRLALAAGVRQTGETAIKNERIVAFSTSPTAEAGRVGAIVELREITAERRLGAARELLMREVDHRARNALAIVQSVVRLTSADDPLQFKAAIVGRVEALARAQTTLTQGDWEGGGLAGICRDELIAIATPQQFDVHGPDLVLPPEQVQPLGMILHELATNAAKHGALSASQGRVELCWSRCEAGTINLHWRETGGPEVTCPQRLGFGSRLVRQLAVQLKARVDHEWASDGLQVRIQVPAAMQNTTPAAC